MSAATLFALPDATDRAALGWTDFPRLGRCPLDPDVMVMICYRNGMIVGPIAAGKRRWDRFPGQVQPYAFDIVAYRLAGDVA